MPSAKLALCSLATLTLAASPVFAGLKDKVTKCAKLRSAPQRLECFDKISKGLRAHRKQEADWLVSERVDPFTDLKGASAILTSSDNAPSLMLSCLNGQMQASFIGSKGVDRGVIIRVDKLPHRLVLVKTPLAGVAMVHEDHLWSFISEISRGESLLYKYLTSPSGSAVEGRLSLKGAEKVTRKLLKLCPPKKADLSLLTKQPTDDVDTDIVMGNLQFKLGPFIEGFSEEELEDGVEAARKLLKGVGSCLDDYPVEEVEMVMSVGSTESDIEPVLSFAPPIAFCIQRKLPASGDNQLWTFDTDEKLRMMVRLEGGQKRAPLDAEVDDAD